MMTMEEFKKIIEENASLFTNEEKKKALFHYKLALEKNVEGMLPTACTLRFLEQYEESVYWLEEAMKLDSVEACYQLGNCYIDGLGVPMDDEKAFSYYMKASVKGHPDAANNLADMYLNGESVPVNEKEAIKWFEFAASKNVVEAMFTLGIIYEQGIGVEADEEKAFQYYLKSAEGGYEDAQYRIGSIYLEGLLNRQQSIPLAIKWFERAADSHHIDSIYNLAFLYEQGYGVVQNIKKALHYYKKASLLGDYQAKLNIATIYEKGIGIKKSIKEANKWKDAAKHQLEQEDCEF